MRRLESIGGKAELKTHSNLIAKNLITTKTIYYIMPKLNNFKKIILATGQINYLASVIETVQLELNGIAGGFAQEQMEEKEDLFETIVTCLSTAIEELTAFTEDHAMVVPIDQRILSVPLEILILGMDDEEDTYEQTE